MLAPPKMLRSYDESLDGYWSARHKCSSMALSGVRLTKRAGNNLLSLSRTSVAAKRPGRVMRMPLARRREPHIWWLGQSPNHRSYGFLSGTKAYSSRSWSCAQRPVGTCPMMGMGSCPAAQANRCLPPRPLGRECTLQLPTHPRGQLPRGRLLDGQAARRHAQDDSAASL